MAHNRVVFPIRTFYPLEVEPKQLFDLDYLFADDYCWSNASFAHELRKSEEPLDLSQYDEEILFLYPEMKDLIE